MEKGPFCVLAKLKKGLLRHAIPRFLTDPQKCTRKISKGRSGQGMAGMKTAAQRTTNNLAARRKSRPLTVNGSLAECRLMSLRVAAKNDEKTEQQSDDDGDNQPCLSRVRRILRTDVVTGVEL